MSQSPVSPTEDFEKMLDSFEDAVDCLSVEYASPIIPDNTDVIVAAELRLNAARSALLSSYRESRIVNEYLTKTLDYAEAELASLRLELSEARERQLTAEEVGAWIAGRWANRSLANTPEAAQWRVLLAAFWDVTRDEAYAEQGRRPDRPQWDIVSLRTALESWGRHHDWCERGPTTSCNCGLEEALRIGQYATDDPNGYLRASLPTPTSDVK